MGCVNWK